MVVVVEEVVIELREVVDEEEVELVVVVEVAVVLDVEVVDEAGAVVSPWVWGAVE